MKARTMVYVEPEQLQALRAEAKAHGISRAELLRRLVQQHTAERLSAPQPEDPRDMATRVQMFPEVPCQGPPVPGHHDIPLPCDPPEPRGSKRPAGGRQRISHGQPLSLRLASQELVADGTGRMLIHSAVPSAAEHPWRRSRIGRARDQRPSVAAVTKR